MNNGKIEMVADSNDVSINTQLGSKCGDIGNMMAGVPATEPDAETLEAIWDFTGDVLTSPMGKFPISGSQAKYVALIDYLGTPVLVVSKSQSKLHCVSEVRSQLRRQGVQWSRELLVGLDVVRMLYARIGYPLGDDNEGLTQTVAMERTFVELITEAANQNASDIHVFVRGFAAEVCFRINSEIVIHREMTSLDATELCQAAFAMADTSDPTYTPSEQQGARIVGGMLHSLGFKGEVESLRLQFNPLAGGGRHMVVRILYNQKAGSQEDIDTLGYSKSQIGMIKKMRQRTIGVNVISGPTGSGKSTTLQRGIAAVLRERPGLTALTIEDPPEYVIEKAAQIPVTNVHSSEDRTEKFRATISGALRSDPDIIMIGEIRDGSSAKLAFQAAMTGHMVWTTLHANGAISIIDRLRDLEVEPFKLWDIANIGGLIAQRLVRRIRHEASVTIREAAKSGYIETEFAKEISALAGKLRTKVRFADAHKEDQNYAGSMFGRTAVAEVILPDQSFLDLIRQGEKSAAVDYWKSNLGGLTMLEHGLLKVLQGEVDPREIEDKVGFFADIDKDRAKWIGSRIDEL